MLRHTCSKRLPLLTHTTTCNQNRPQFLFAYCVARGDLMKGRRWYQLTRYLLRLDSCWTALQKTRYSLSCLLRSSQGRPALSLFRSPRTSIFLFGGGCRYFRGMTRVYFQVKAVQLSIRFLGTLTPASLKVGANDHWCYSSAAKTPRRAGADGSTENDAPDLTQKTRLVLYLPNQSDTQSNVWNTRRTHFWKLRDRGEASSKGASKNKRPSGNKTSTGGGAARLPPGTEEGRGAEAA